MSFDKREYQVPDFSNSDRNFSSDEDSQSPSPSRNGDNSRKKVKKDMSARMTDSTLLKRAQFCREALKEYLSSQGLHNDILNTCTSEDILLFLQRKGC